jgi:hypothetical protein
VRRIGIALEPSRATVSVLAGLLRPRPALPLEFALPDPEAEEWRDAIAAMLAEVRRRSGAGKVPLTVALLRPMASTKALRLPPLRADELQVLARRAAERWFPFPTGEAVSACRLRGAAQSGPQEVNVVVSAADSGVVDALLEVARGAGIEISCVSAGARAAAAALRGRPELAAGEHLVVLLFGSSTEALHLHAGELRGVRSIPFTAASDPHECAMRRAAQIWRALGGEGDTRPAVWLAGEVDAELANALDATGEGPAPFWRPLVGVGAPEALAAVGAGLPAVRRHDLRPADYRRPAHRAALRRTAALLACAAATTLFSAAAHLRNVEAETLRVQEMRSMLRPGTQTALRTRAEIDTLRARIAALQAVDEARPRWVPFFARFSGSLPQDAYIQSLRADNGEIAIEGYARDAASLVLKFEGQQRWRDVRFTAPLQREQTPLGERERFSLRLGAPEFLPPARQTSDSGEAGNASASILR